MPLADFKAETLGNKSTYAERLSAVNSTQYDEIYDLIWSDIYLYLIDRQSAEAMHNVDEINGPVAERVGFWGSNVFDQETKLENKA